MEPNEIEICREAFSLAQRSLEKSQKQTGTFENLQKIIPVEILKQIESFKKPLHCIFVISSDFDLVAGIAGYIYHVHASGSFTHLSYSGYTDQEIISDLFPPSPPNKFRLDHYLRGRMLFISGLGNNHQLVFERLLGAFRELNFSNPYRKEFGFLVIGVKDTALIPQELIKLSDVIAFESEKQTLFPMPSDIKISDAKMIFLDDENVRITINEKSRSFHYAEMGFSHKQGLSRELKNTK